MAIATLSITFTECIIMALMTRAELILLLAVKNLNLYIKVWGKKSKTYVKKNDCSFVKDKATIFFFLFKTNI